MDTICWVSSMRSRDGGSTDSEMHGRRLPVRLDGCQQRRPLRVRARARGARVPHVVLRQLLPVAALPPRLTGRPHPPLHHRAHVFCCRVPMRHRVSSQLCGAGGAGLGNNVYLACARHAMPAAAHAESTKSFMQSRNG